MPSSLVAQRQDATITFINERAARIVQAVERLPGVMRAEPYRSVLVRLRNGHLQRKLAIHGKPATPQLSRVVDLAQRSITLPPSGLPVGFTKVSALGIEEQRVKVVLSLTGEPGQRRRLGHDYRVFVRIVVHQSADALLVPLGALFRQGDAWAVFVVERSRARVRIIEVGARNAQRAEIVGGLAAGERVILHPSDRVLDGVRVVERRS